MKLLRVTSIVAGMIFLAACVTINIYFPSAEAREAAEQIVDDILGEGAKQQPPGSDDQSRHFIPADRAIAFNLIDLLISPAEAAQPKFEANTPGVRKLQASMKQRHASLKGYYQSGAIGFTRDARVGTRDLAAVPLKQRGQVKNLVKAENQDRDQLYKEIARANGHPEWEKDVRQTFAKTWVNNAAKGWWYQDSKGAWRQK